MAFNNVGKQAAQEWQNYLLRMQQQQQVDPRSTATIRTPQYQQQQASDAESGFTSRKNAGNPALRSGSVGNTGAGKAGTSSPANAASSYYNASNASSDPGSASGGGDMDYVRPGQFYSDYPEGGLMKLSQDPARAVDEWAKFNSMGPAYGRYLNSIIDPMSALRLQGVDAGKLSINGTPRLDAFNSLWRRMSGDASQGGQNNYYTDPRGMLSNVLNAKYKEGDEATSLGSTLNGPLLLPEEQVQNTIGLILNGLQGYVSDESLNAYSSMLNQAAMDYLAMRDKSPTSWDNGNTFNTYLKSRFGSGGGLF